MSRRSRHVAVLMDNYFGREHEEKDTIQMTRRSIRSSPRVKNSIYRFASSLQIGYDHEIIEERILMNIFINQIETAADNDLNFPVIFRENAIYVKPILRYTNTRQKWLHQKILKKDNILGNNSIFSGNEATTILSMVRIINWIFSCGNRNRVETEQGVFKPIVILVGGELRRAIGEPVTGHCSTVIIHKDIDRKIKIWIKDCRSINELSVVWKVVKLASVLRVKTVKIIPALNNEESPNCLLESLRFAAKVLDGSITSTSIDTLPQIKYFVKGKKYSDINTKEKKGTNHLLNVKLVGDMKRFIDKHIQIYKNKVYRINATRSARYISQEKMKKEISQIVMNCKASYRRIN